MGESALSPLHETDQADKPDEIGEVRPTLTSLETGRNWPDYNMDIRDQNVFGNPPLHTTRDNRTRHVAHRTMEAVKTQTPDYYLELIKSWSGTRPSQELNAMNAFLESNTTIRKELRSKQQWVDIETIIDRVWFGEWASHNHPAVQAEKLVIEMNEERKTINTQLSGYQQFPTLKDSDLRDLRKDLCLIFQGNEIRMEVDLILVGYKVASALFHSPKFGGLPVPPKQKNKR